jgi:hypothetical protein
VVPGVGGIPYRVELTANAVHQLRDAGVARFGSGQSEVTVVVGADRTSAPVSVAYEARADVALADHPTTHGVSGRQQAYMARPLPPLSPDAFTIGLYLPWTQTWRLKGYSRGVLAHSLTLAPQEDATIELFTWDRRTRSLDQSATIETDQSIEQTDTTKDVLEVVRELANSSEFQIEGHARVNITYANVSAEIGAGGNYTSQLNATARVSTNHLDESTQRAAARVRVTRQTRISETSEIGSEERVTRKVRNANMCRTLTLDYFEVLAHYDVTTAFDKDDAEVCVFVPFPPLLQNKIFSEVDLRIHEQPLRAALLDRALADGFEAARRSYARMWAMMHVCDGPECTPKASSAGTQTTTSAKSVPRTALDAAVKQVIQATKTLRDASLEGIVRDAGFAGVEPSQEEVLAVQRYGFWGLLGRKYGSLREGLVQVASNDDVNEEKIARLEALASANPPANLKILDIPGLNDSELMLIFGPAIRGWVRNMGYDPDAFQLDGFSAGQAAVLRVFSAIGRLNGYDPDDAGLIDALTTFHKESQAYHSASDSGLGLPGGGAVAKTQEQAKGDANADQVRNAFPLSDAAAAAERADALVQHLNEFSSHYRYALLQAMPIGDQMRELVQAGVPADIVEPRILGMVNGGLAGVDLLAIPINTALKPEWKRVRDAFIDQNTELTALKFNRIIRMPTPGVSVEARLGQCDACEEFIMESRDVDIAERRARVRSERAAAHQAELEAERLQARLDKGTLDPPTPAVPSLRVTVDGG